MNMPAALLLLAVLAMPRPTSAQQVPFQQSYDVDRPVGLDVSTVRGRIDITAGDAARVVITGTVTVRIGWDVPADAFALARQVADRPPVERAGNVISLRPPREAAEHRAVTVSYRVQVPRDTMVTAVSDSGAITVSDVAGDVSIRTQSATIAVAELAGRVTITTGSGAVTADAVTGDLGVETSSSAFLGRALAGALRVDTGSGAIDATLTGSGDVDARTRSSAIRIQGATRSVRASTQSGRVAVAGTPGAAWEIESQSGSVALEFTAASGAHLDVASRSGSITVHGATVEGDQSPRAVAGAVGGGGPTVRVRTGSGSTRVTVGAG